MIEYSKGPYSLNTIFRVQGSILYASLLPGLFSVIIFTLFRNVYGLKNEKDDLKLPDVVGLLVSSVSLLYRKCDIDTKYHVPALLHKY